ncbi:MAG: hypothetical protein JWN69_696 [Alphaproteobacteria bacterium]|nr:hypothetical protein [Alphaproteobacteria bacterium]
MNVFTAPVTALFPPHHSGHPALPNEEAGPNQEAGPNSGAGADSEDGWPAAEPEDPFGGAVRSFLRLSIALCVLILAAGAFFLAARSTGARVLGVLGLDLTSAAFGAMLIALAAIFYLFIGRTIVTVTKE